MEPFPNDENILELLPDAEVCVNQTNAGVILLYIWDLVEDLDS